jgi:hypothetical protein
MNFNARRFIIVKSELLISDRTDQIKKKSLEKFFLLYRGCRSEGGEGCESMGVRSFIFSDL